MASAAPRRVNAPAGNTAAIEFEILDLNLVPVTDATGTITVTDEDTALVVATALPITYVPASTTRYKYRAIAPSSTFVANARYRCDVVIVRTSDGSVGRGVLYAYGVTPDYLL